MPAGTVADAILDTVALEIGDAVIVRLAGGGSLRHLRVLTATLGQPCEPHSRQASSIRQLADAESRLHLPTHQARLRALLSSQPLRDTKLAERLPRIPDC